MPAPELDSVIDEEVDDTAHDVVRDNSGGQVADDTSTEQDDGLDQGAETDDQDAEREFDPQAEYGFRLPEDPREVYQTVAQTRREAEQARQWQLLHSQSQAEIAQLRQEQQAESQRQQQWASYQQQQQAEQQRQAALPKWDAPEFKPEWAQLLTRDENGNIVALPGAMPDLPQKYAAYQTWLADKQATFWRNPSEFIQQQAGQHIQQVAQQIAQQQLQQYHQWMQQQQSQEADKSYASQFVNDNLDWLAELGSDGKPVFNPNGSPRFNEFGQRFDNRISELRGMQHRDGTPVSIKQATDIAFKEFKAEAYEHESDQRGRSTQTADANAQKKRDFLKAGRSRTGTREKPGQKSPNKVTSSNLKDVMRERMEDLPAEDFISRN